METKATHIYEEEYASRLKLDLMYVKNEYKKLESQVKVKDDKIAHQNKIITNLNNKLTEISNLFTTKEKEYKERIDELELLINPEEEQSESRLVKILDKIGIKVSQLN